MNPPQVASFRVVLSPSFQLPTGSHPFAFSCHATLSLLSFHPCHLPSIHLYIAINVSHVTTAFSLSLSLSVDQINGSHSRAQGSFSCAYLYDSSRLSSPFLDRFSLSSFFLFSFFRNRDSALSLSSIESSSSHIHVTEGGGGGGGP